MKKQKNHFFILWTDMVAALIFLCYIVQLVLISGNINTINERIAKNFEIRQI